MFEVKDLRSALGCFATGVALITTRGADGRAVGVTVNSFTSLSLEPPLVLWSLMRASPSTQAFDQAEGFIVHVLSEHQEPMSRLFGQRGVEKWAQTPHVNGPLGLPQLEGAHAVIACRRKVTQDGGDHLIYVGEVMSIEVDERVRPLIFYKGRYCALAA